ncbi:MAG: Nramp family divalent metal transporter [Bacteroidota bacterium]
MTQHTTSKSLSEVHGSVAVPHKRGFWKTLLAFLGPAYLVSVGYMDPGNWATDLAGGSQFGYALIWVLLMSNLMALLLQSLSARLGLVRGLDLAQASRHTYPKFINIPLYILAEVAIAACDLAEVIGMAIGLQLLFKIDLLTGVIITLADTFLLLFLINKGIRKMEAFIVSMIAIIGVSFFIEMLIVKPNASELVRGFIPSLPNSSALYIAIGIIGATVMPHNLYLHSSLVQTRRFNRADGGLKKAIRFNFIDSAVALNLALFVNAAILILAAAAFYKRGLHDVAEIQDAHLLLTNIFGTAAPALFAIALIAAGQSSTITGTLAGQIVMEGYLNLRIRPWLRRILTRLIAIAPAVFTIVYFGEAELGKLLILSQVILSLQLGFAIIPLIHFVSDKTKMGEFVIKPWVKILAWVAAAIIVGLNVKLVINELSGWIESAGNNAVYIYVFVLPIVIAAGVLLLYITFSPLFKTAKTLNATVPHGKALELGNLQLKEYKNIAVTIDFSDMDKVAIENAISQGGKTAAYTLIHIVESAGASVMGEDIEDLETGEDINNLNSYCAHLQSLGYSTEVSIGYGNPAKAISEIVNNSAADLIVMGGHGHKTFKDILFGATVDTVRHNIKIPVLVVRK